jgi:hypothetical protein
MGEVLMMAAEMRGYTLTDRATYAATGPRPGWKSWCRVIRNCSTLTGDRRESGAASRCQSRRRDAVHRWLTSEGQAAIGAFRVDGEQLFFPARAEWTFYTTSRRSGAVLGDPTLWESSGVDKVSILALILADRWRWRPDSCGTRRLSRETAAGNPGAGVPVFSDGGRACYFTSCCPGRAWRVAFAVHPARDGPRADGHCLPVLAAYTLTAVQGADPRAYETAASLGAGRLRAAMTTLWEVRFGVWPRFSSVSAGSSRRSAVR